MLLSNNIEGVDSSEVKGVLKTYIHNTQSKLRSYQAKMGRCKTTAELNTIVTQCLDDSSKFHDNFQKQCKSDKVKTLMKSAYGQSIESINKFYNQATKRINDSTPSEKIDVDNVKEKGIYKVPKLETNYPPTPCQTPYIPIPKDMRSREFSIESLIEYMTKCGIHLLKNMMGMIDKIQFKNDLDKEKETFLNELSVMYVPIDLHDAMKITAEKFVEKTLDLDNEPYREMSLQVYHIMIDFNNVCKLYLDSVKDNMFHEDVKSLLDKLKLTYESYNYRIELLVNNNQDTVPFNDIKGKQLIDEYRDRMQNMYNETVQEVVNKPTKSFMDVYNETIKKTDKLIEDKFNELVNQAKGMATQTMAQMKSTLTLSKFDTDDFIENSYKEIHNRIMKSYMDTFDHYFESVLIIEYEVVMNSITKTGDVSKFMSYKLDRRDEVRDKYRKRMCDVFIGSHPYHEYDNYPAEQSYMDDDWENEETIVDIDF